MLRKDAIERATLEKVLNHQWMLKGFSAGSKSFIPHREPLKLPLDATVVEEMSRMTSLNLGSADSISEKLCDIVESLDYIKAVSQATCDMEDLSIDPLMAPGKRSMFHFCRNRNKENNQDPRLSRSGCCLAAFHPLVSVYHLTRERIERERDSVLGEYIPLLSRVSD